MSNGQHFHIKSAQFSVPLMNRSAVEHEHARALQWISPGRGKVIVLLLFVKVCKTRNILKLALMHNVCVLASMPPWL